MLLQRKPGGGDRPGTSEMLPEAKRTGGNAQSLKHGEQPAPLACLIVLHSPGTETHGKEQSERKRHQGGMAHSFTITSKMEWKALPASSVKYQHKNSRKREGSP